VQIAKKQWPKTEAILHELNPEFPDRIVVPVRAKNENDMRGKFLVLNVWDKDKASVDDPIGTMTINCEKLVGEESSIVFTDEPLTRFGKKHGTISFKVDVYWPEIPTGSMKSIKNTFRSFGGKSGEGGSGEGGCCSIS